LLATVVASQTGLPANPFPAAPSTAGPSTVGAAPVFAGDLPSQPRNPPPLSLFPPQSTAGFATPAAAASPGMSGPYVEDSSEPSTIRLPLVSTSPVQTPAVAPIAAPASTTLLRYYDPFSNQFAYGNAGVQPYLFGWYSYDDVLWIPTAAARGTTGSFQDVEWNSYFRYARAINDTLIFSWSPTWNASFWTGPTGVPLPSEVDQISSDLQLASASGGPWNFQIGFTPQVNSDFKRQLDSNAFMFDGRAVLFYQSSPNLRWAFGFAYWNRVIDQFIPYGGVVWAPNDRWEFRIFFPKTRISRYCGTALGGPVWTYGTVEYNVQAYQIDMQDAAATKTRGEVRDYRAMLGVYTEHPSFTTFAECGIVFDRQFYFRDASFNFGVNPSVMGRLGLSF
jgi:hypothetical protein